MSHDTWRRSPALPALRARLRAEYDRPGRRWSDLAVTCAMVAGRDGRPASARVADVAQRQTYLRYSA
ncbi:MAG TPA: hypothetical protein VLI04_06015 [Nocardioidaceae bacterium]|nr:hypothetical protein [Nocardioidaceae bacterium]